MKNILKNLGLSTNETLIYEALVKLGGSASAGEIIKATDLHRNIVYDSLGHLKTKNLIQEVQKNKIKFFTLKNPSILATGFKNQIKNTLALTKIFNSLPGDSGHEVNIYEGGVAWQEAWRGIMQKMKPGSIFYTIGMAGDPWVKLMGETFIEYEQWALKNKIVDKIISQKHLKKEIEAHQNMTFRDMRYVDISLPAYVSIEVFEDRVFFEIYEDPSALIEIKSIAMAKTFKAYFELLWAIGKKG